MNRVLDNDVFENESSSCRFVLQRKAGLAARGAKTPAAKAKLVALEAGAQVGWPLRRRCDAVTYCMPTDNEAHFGQPRVIVLMGMNSCDDR